MTRTIAGWTGLAAMAACGFLAISAGAEPVKLPGGRSVDKVDFERHVQALFGRQGCNSGACHGSLQGRGGLYLSLFGYSPQHDYLAFTREAAGRRVSIAHPDESLLLLKASGQVSHGGEMRFGKNSWQYQVIREWIAAGAAWHPDRGKVRKVSLSPTELVFSRPDEAKQLKVMVEFDDGSVEDMTHFCEYRAQDDYVMHVSPDGEVKSLRPGETAILVSYRGQIQVARALLPVAVAADFVYPRVAESNFIDREVFGKLRKLNIVPSDLSGDAEFLRRITIDTIGSLPSPDEVRKFLADPDPQKRTRKIDELLRHPLHAALWATKFSDITGNNVEVMDAQVQMRPKKAKMWHDWLRKRIADNMPYDQLVKGILTATSRDDLEPLDWAKKTIAIEQAARTGFDTDYAKRAGLDLFWRRVAGKTFFTMEQMAEHTATAFLGIRIECAQCHKHPQDRWTQADYRSFANVFGQVKFGVSPEAKTAISKAQAEIQQAQKAAQAELNAAIAARRKVLAGPLEKELAERRKTAEETLDKENAERRDAVLKAVANDPPEKQKTALAAVDKSNAKIKQFALAKIDRENSTRRQKIQFELDKEFAPKRRELQARFTNQFGFGFQSSLQEVYISEQPLRQLAHPETNEVLQPKVLGGPAIEYKGDAREALHRWLVEPDNPYFARNLVNRVWAHYFGVGLVEPVDAFSAANPPSNEKLLDALAKDFVAHRFDLRRLERTILESRTYQLSARPNASNKHDRNNYARSYPRRPMAEVVVDMLNTALDVTENFGPDVPVNSRAIEVAPNKIQSPTLTTVFRLFGRPLRAATCDCERAAEPALPQTLFLMTDDSLLNKMAKGRLARLLADKKTDAEAVEELFLATLSRFPEERERNAALAHVVRAANRQAGLLNVVWALINTREFILNH